MKEFTITVAENGFLVTWYGHNHGQLQGAEKTHYCFESVGTLCEFLLKRFTYHFPKLPSTEGVSDVGGK